MSESLIAVQGAVLIPKEAGVTASLLITTPPDPKWNINDKKIFKGILSIQITGAVEGACTQSATQITTLQGDADWNINGEDIVRENKEGNTVTINGTLPNSSSCSFALTPKIQSAGQTKWKVEHD